MTSPRATGTAAAAWTAPAPDRVDPPDVADERAALEGWLDFHRATLLTKCAGLTGEQLTLCSAPPSTLSLLGLVRHLAEVECSWFRHRVGGDESAFPYSTDDNPDGDLHDGTAESAERDFATYAEQVSAARVAAAGRGLDETFQHRDGTAFDLRWAYLHMIEEYARHNGHADLLRERIDGATGD
jgi:hypothetical protein